MDAPQEIKDLVNTFETNKYYYKSNEYDEENTKIDFINPFFIALGWNVHNENNKEKGFKTVSPLYKDVVFEQNITKGRRNDAHPDYTFRIGSEPKFFVEAKKPKVEIETDKNPAYQIRRYGWSAGLPLCILTDFETLAIYETTTKPDKNQKASIGRIKLYHYTDYIEKWDEISSIFSKDSVLSGKFDTYIKGYEGIKKGTSQVDAEFLKELDTWRLLLARNIALRNKNLNIDELNYAVQLIIDRILFLRIAEDRGIEKYEQLKKLLEYSNNDKNDYPVYREFLKLCEKADLKYNSGLFHFNEEKDNDFEVDTLTPNLKIDDNIFKKIFKNLYYPDSPYEFSMISTEILGKVYEQFLGKIIRLTDSHQAKVEEKPEVKKAGGVYYTPQYIVKYIVENTIGKLIENKTPNQVSKMTFVDPACGSGSFLLGAYQYLIDWHVKYYSGMKRPPKNVIYTGKDNITRLTISEKKRILLNNIYGVDIDSQAVEVTKLSLLLKVLEDSNKDQLEAQQKLFQERVLPDLNDNIKCGNSLVGTDILEQQDLPSEEYIRINPFDWREEFPEIFKNGGFDAVIGNPPYVNIENISDKSKKYYMENYNTFEKRSDLYSAFLELSLKITREYSAFIIPSTIFTNTSYKKLRNIILNNHYLETLCYTGYDVFKEVIVDTTIIVMNKRMSQEIQLINALNFKNKNYTIVDKDYFSPYENVLSIDDVNTSQILEKIFKRGHTRLGDHFKVFQGIVTGNNEAYLFDSEEDALREGIAKELLHSVLYGKNISRYSIDDKSNRIIYIDKNTDMKKYPNTLNYLKQYKKKLSKQKSQSATWYQLHRPRIKEELETEKIILQRTRNERLKIRTVATIDDTGTYAMESLYCIIPKTGKYSLYYILALINSNLINYLFAKKYLNLGIKRDYLNNIHIPKITLEEQEPLINLAKDIIQHKNELKNSNTPVERKLIQKQIDTTEKKINEKVYQLYELTQEEIKIIEDDLMD